MKIANMLITLSKPGKAFLLGGIRSDVTAFLQLNKASLHLSTETLEISLTAETDAVKIKKLSRATNSRLETIQFYTLADNGD